MKINFSPPYIDADVVNEVVDSLNSGWITTGPKVAALENSIKEFVGAQQVLCVNSWTSGAILILKWLGLKSSDEVILPAYTYAATALAVIHAGGKPVMVDINEDFNISTEEIRKAITPNTKAIIGVDIAGYPCDYTEIMSIVTEKEILSKFKAESEIQQKLGRILVMNDAAHSLGATYKDGCKTGSETDITIFSLHAVKNITTAEGGAICINMPSNFNNDELYTELRRMTLNCQTKDALSKSKAGGWRYDIIGLGMKINMADVNAAIGLAQFRKYPELLNRRKEIFMKYLNGFSTYEWAILPPHKNKEKESSYHIFLLRFKNLNEASRDTLINEITAKEIAVNVHFVPLPMLSYFNSLGYDIKNFPQSLASYSNEITLPLYPQLTNEEVDYIIQSVVESYQKVIKE